MARQESIDGSDNDALFRIVKYAHGVAASFIDMEHQMKATRKTLLGAGLALALLGGAGNAMADSVWSSAITKWDGDCSGGQRDWWDDMCMAWRHEMADRGFVPVWENFHLVKVGKYADPSITNWAYDNSRMDAHDAGLICTHGSIDGPGWVGTMHTREGGECGLNVNQMKLGKASGGRMRFFHMSSCQSMQWDNRLAWFGAAKGGVHVIAGFHGLMYIGSQYVDEYEELAADGTVSKGVGKAWVDNMHHVDHWYNSYKTICPVAMGFGNTAARSADVLNERYASKWSDTAANWATTRYISGCDPSTGGGALPN